MKILRIVLIAVISLLGLGAGIAKVMLMPDELAYFSRAGLTETWLVLLGMLQLLGAILFIFLKFRVVGAYVLAFTFLVSSIVIFWAGDWVFGLFSLLPIALIMILMKTKPN